MLRKVRIWRDLILHYGGRPFCENKLGRLWLSNQSCVCLTAVGIHCSAFPNITPGATWAADWAERQLVELKKHFLDAYASQRSPVGNLMFQAFIHACMQSC
jgi:hypothetical protein